MKKGALMSGSEFSEVKFSERNRKNLNSKEQVKLIPSLAFYKNQKANTALSSNWYNYI